jgi:hypothetical protein
LLKIYFTKAEFLSAIGTKVLKVFLKVMLLESPFPECLHGTRTTRYCKTDENDFTLHFPAEERLRESQGR